MTAPAPITSRIGRLLIIGAASIFLARAAELAAQPVDQSVAPQPPGPPQPPGTPQPQPIPITPWAAFPAIWLAFLVIMVAIAVTQKKRIQEEEEEVTPLSADLATEFEYKIIRTPFGTFKKLEGLKAMLAEESRAGWELFEKLDDNRVRLRRSTACRQRDAELTQDPYRTQYSADDRMRGLRVVLLVLVMLA